MFEKFKIWLILLIFALILSFLLPFNNIISFFKYSLYKKDDLLINLSIINQKVKYLSSDPSNKLYLNVAVFDLNGDPIPNARVILSSLNNIGSISQNSIYTEKDGHCITSYIPPQYEKDFFKDGNVKVTLEAKLNGTDKVSSVDLELTRVPVVYIHGYQSSSQIFKSMREELQHNGFEGIAIDYKSENGVINASNELNTILKNLKTDYISKGYQVEKFDAIAHSMGGLVLRYYTSSKDYIVSNNIRKELFISVPNKGSPLASLGAAYFNDQSVKDLAPQSGLLANVFPSLLNKGLNPSIQTGSIIAQFDEVVPQESASLEEWGIKTDIFKIGEKSFTMDNLLKGNIMDAENHKNILGNKKVFEKIIEMLDSDLEFPLSRKK